MPLLNKNVFDLRMTQVVMRNTVHYLDNCMFVEHDDDADRNRILALDKAKAAVFAIPKSVKDEVNDLGTPIAARQKASDMLFSFPVRPSAEEERKRGLVEAILKGQSKSDKHLPDAHHVLEAGLHHGYFITLDDRLINRKDELKAACGVRIVNPAEWLALWDTQQ